MKAIIVNFSKKAETRMTWRKGWVLQLLEDTSERWYNRYTNLLWDVEIMESDLGSDYIVEELLDETKKELHALEHHLGFDKVAEEEPEWDFLDFVEEEEP